jgi:tetratricopeptide (TPR) repeat protein
MVTFAQPQVESEPTPEFDEQCLATLREWESGALPFQEAMARLTRYRENAVAAKHVANQGRAEQLLGNLQHFHGNLTTSVQHWERARKLFSEVNNRLRVAGIDLNIGESYRFKGDFTRALRLYRTAYNIARELGNVRMQAIAAANEGLVLVTTGQHAAAQNVFEKALSISAWDRWPEDDRNTLIAVRCEVHHGLATIYLEEGDLDAAWEQALEAVDLLQDGGQPMQRGYANRIAGQVITRLGRSPDPEWSDDPDTYFRKALDAFREINAEAELARTMYAQALSLAQRGRRTTAARKLQQVMIIFSRLGMIDDAARAAESQLAIT